MSQCEMAIWGCENSVTPEPIDFKFRLYVYVGDYTSCAKFRKIRLGGASRKYDEIYTLHARNFYFFLSRVSMQNCRYYFATGLVIKRRAIITYVLSRVLGKTIQF